jgi:hypothetical protein
LLAWLRALLSLRYDLLLRTHGLSTLFFFDQTQKAETVRLRVFGELDLQQVGHRRYETTRTSAKKIQTHELFDTTTHN